ncbi:DUF4190 domain-containing protein [Cognatilysobacter segetis]|uniref:DUF4190 domain-containing protein n=1 Tax=Cognatilysobacter segetis TaxID=2492394 RepID=UPI001060D4C8|nr:DUF4190 domain-containing protein [Lysobacter segetis]
MNALPPPSASTLPTSPLAIASLVFGIACWVVLPVLGSLGAIICGHLAKREIRDAHGRVGGSGMATAGLALGYVHLAFAIIATVFVILLFGGFAAALLAIGLHAH